MTFGRRLNLALEEITPNHRRVDRPIMRCKKCKNTYRNADLVDGMCTECMLESIQSGQAIQEELEMTTGKPTSTDLAKELTGDVASDIDSQEFQDSELKRMNQDQEEIADGEGERAKWEPLEKKWKQLEMQLRDAQTRAEATKQPSDYQLFTSMSDQVKAAEDAYKRTRWPKIPPQELSPI